MIMKVIGVTALVPLAIAIGGCATPSQESCSINYTATGAAVGVVAGAALGAGIAAIANAGGGAIGVAALGGALVGGIVGAIAGHQQDKACHAFALKQALDQAAVLNASLPPETSRAPSTSQGTVARSTPATPEKPRTYQTVAWANQMTSNSGTITPLGVAADSASDQVCMTYVDQQTVRGQVQSVTSKACRGSDGEWKPVI